MVIIPNADFPAYFESVILDGVPYVFGFIWNTRDSAWSMSISREGLVLLASIKVVDNFELISRYVNTLLPKGEILTLDLQGIQQNPNRDQLGNAVKIAYVTESEVLSGTF